MATTRPFAYNPGAPIPGTIQVGDLSVGVPLSGFTTSPQYWNGPDEDLGYVITIPVSGNTQPTEISGVTASIGFYRTDGFNDGEFIQLSEIVSNEFGNTIVIQQEKIIIIDLNLVSKLVYITYPQAGWTAVWINQDTIATGSSEGISIFDTNKNTLKHQINLHLDRSDWEFTCSRSLFYNHENKPTTLGQSLDVENYIPWSDQTERITPSSILTNNIVQSISTNSIRHMKDGVINLLIQSPMSYFTREEIPYSARGIKADTKQQTQIGTSKISRNQVPFYDFDPELKQQQSFTVSDVKYMCEPFYDTLNTVQLGNVSITIEDDDFSRYEIRGSTGFIYSKAQSKTDSIVFGGLYR